MVAELREILRAREDWRTPGCSDLCKRIRAIPVGQFGVTAIEQHHAESHEAYGISLGALEAGTAVEDVLTGPLAVRLLHVDALVDGVSASLTPKEYQILAVLARKAGRVVAHEAILRDVWGPEYVPEGWEVRAGAHDAAHLVRVNVARLRAKLGPAKRLIETRPYVGYMLRAEPYTGPVLP